MKGVDDMKTIWVVVQDMDGEVSYWSTREKAYEEARNLVKAFCQWSCNRDEYNYTIANLTDEVIDKEFKDIVWVVEREFEKPWL